MKKPIAVALADVHWTTNAPEYRRETGAFQSVIAAKLRLPLDFAAENDVPVFIAGDVFDRSREFMDMWTFVDFLDSFDFLPDIFVIPGQHDLFHHNREDGATSLEMAKKSVEMLNGFDVRVLGRGAAHVYACGWNDAVPVPIDRDAFNILLVHRTLWHRAPPYPGAPAEGNIASFGAALAKTGYRLVFSGDNHRAFDAEAGGVRFVNLGCFTRDDVSYRDQRPRYCVLYDDLSVESVYVGGKDVFDLGRSDADKGREDRKDGFSEALAGGFERGQTFKGALENTAASGKCGDAELTGRQSGILKDVINAI